MTEEEIFAEMGEEGFQKITAAFYQKVRTDELIGPMYPDGDWDGSEERLREFLLFRFGGDSRYLEKRGHPRLRARHLPYSIGVAERDRWLELMGAAMEEEISNDEVRKALMAFFAQVADFMRNRPDGMDFEKK